MTAIRWTIVFRNGRALVVTMPDSTNLLQGYIDSVNEAKPGARRIFVVDGLLVDMSEVVAISGLPATATAKALAPVRTSG